jgi:hypothetical protein
VWRGFTFVVELLDDEDVRQLELLKRKATTANVPAGKKDSTVISKRKQNYAGIHSGA